MWRMHISKHFETAPPPSAAIYGPRQKPSLSNKDNTIGKQECMTWEKEGLGWSEGVISVVAGGSLRNKSFGAKVEQQPLDCLEDDTDCGFRGLFALKWYRFLKRTSEVTAFSFFFSPCVVQESSQGPETLISLGRDSYTHPRRHKHTHRVVAPSLLLPGPGPLISLVAEGQ